MINGIFYVIKKSRGISVIHLQPLVDLKWALAGVDRTTKRKSSKTVFKRKYNLIILNKFLKYRTLTHYKEDLDEGSSKTDQTNPQENQKKAMVTEKIRSEKQTLKWNQKM